MKLTATSLSGNRPSVLWTTALATTMLLVSLAVTAGFHGFTLRAFCMPAAWLAAKFMGVPCVTTPDGYALALEHMPLQVTLACSATRFFALLVAFMAAVLVESPRVRSIAKLLWIIPAAYGVTLVANVARIVLGWYAGRVAQATLPEAFRYSVHTSVGIVVFVFFLILSYIILIWRQTHERRSR